jgi:hypothetical protein
LKGEAWKLYWYQKAADAAVRPNTPKSTHTVISSLRFQVGRGCMEAGLDDATAGRMDSFMPVMVKGQRNVTGRKVECLKKNWELE